MTSFGFGFSLIVEALPGFRFPDGENETRVSCGGAGGWVGVANASSTHHDVTSSLRSTSCYSQHDSLVAGDVCPPLPILLNASQVSDVTDARVGSVETIACVDGFEMATLNASRVNLTCDGGRLEWVGDREDCTGAI